MRRKKIFIILMTVIAIVVISATVFATKKMVQYNEQGKVIIYSGEERPDEIEENDEIDFNTILIKYYGEDIVTKLYDNINKEKNGIMTHHTITDLSDSQKELFNMTFELIEGTKATSEEKEILINGLKSIDISNIEDKELVDKVNSL